MESLRLSRKNIPDVARRTGRTEEDLTDTLEKAEGENNVVFINIFRTRVE